MNVSQGLYIGVKRIIAVDSSDFAYVELEIDKHSMLVAQGNVGKSSLINAIRLFFLPECSMAKQAVNFGFSDSHGEYYSSEASYYHYFPSKYSFLILEYEKRLFNGEHACQILTMGNGRLKFERMFTSLPYAKLQHLFWQEGTDEDGIGGRVEKLNKQHIYEYINKHDKYAVLAKEASKVASLIYESELNATRFTLFPLSKADEQQINSLRALIKLLFVASSRNKKPFTQAIANIIESGKKQAQDQLGFSIAEFKATHENLKAEETRLNTIINQQNNFNKLIKTRDTFLDFIAILGQVNPTNAWLEKELNQSKQQLQTLADKRATANEKLIKAKQKLKKEEDDQRAFSREVKDKTKELRVVEAKSKRINELSAEYFGETNIYISDMLKGEIANNQKQLDVFDGNVKKDEAIAKLDIEIQQLLEKKNIIETAIEAKAFNLENQLSKQALNVLHSIQPQLSQANTTYALEQADIDSINGFVQLFEEQANTFQFYDQSIAYQPFKAPNRQAQLNNIEQELTALYRQKKGMQAEHTNPIQAQQVRKEIVRALTLAQADLDIITDADYINRRVTDLTKELDILKDQISANEKLKQTAIKDLDIARQKFDKLNNEYEAYKRELGEFEQQHARLNSFMLRNKAWLSLGDQDEVFNGYFNNEQLDIFEKSASELSELKFQMISSLRNFIEDNVINDKCGIKGDAPLWHEIAATIEDVSEVYGNLDTERHLLAKQIEGHNQTIGTKREVLIQNYRVIKNFEKEINDSFSSITINNIEKVEFEVGINKQFEALVKEFEHTNLFASEMQSDAFYERLVAFAEKFFDHNDNFILTMDKVVESFEPHVKLKNKTGKEDKQQSNSTNALIKTKLVQLLLKRLLAHKTDTSFPIVHDEIANIDISQFDWWLRDLSDAGFCLLAAGTHSTSAELQAKIGRRHVLDAMTTAFPYHQERNRVYWQGAEEFLSHDLHHQQSLV